jgi:exportin-1
VQAVGLVYQKFFVLFMQEVFYVLTDTFHKSGDFIFIFLKNFPRPTHRQTVTEFRLQATILMHMFALVERNQLSTPIFDVAQHPGVQSNKEFLGQYIANLLTTSFPNLTRFVFNHSDLN